MPDFDEVLCSVFGGHTQKQSGVTGLSPQAVFLTFLPGSGEGSVSPHALTVGLFFPTSQRWVGEEQR